MLFTTQTLDKRILMSRNRSRQMVSSGELQISLLIFVGHQNNTALDAATVRFSRVHLNFFLPCHHRRPKYYSVMSINLK